MNDGLAQYDGLQTNLDKRFSHGFSMLLSYTWSHTINTVEPDVPGQDPNDANILGRVKHASSLLDQRHRASLSGWWQFTRNWAVGGATFLASGRPFNVTTGVDNNGDGSNADRPVVSGRQFGRGRGTPRYDVQTFVQRDFGFAADRVLVYSGGRVQSAQSQQRRGSKRRLGRRGEAAAVVRSADRRNQQCGSWKRVSVRAARPVLNRRAEAALPMFRSRGAKTALFGTIRGETK